jgi:drug/metabolite transporter (DMT)-like permease
MNLSSKSKGMLWFLAQSITMPITVVFVRLAAEGAEIPVLIFIQNLLTLTLVSLGILYKGISVKTQRIKLHIIRNCFGLGSWTCFFYAVTLMPLNSATAITFMAPLVATLMAVIFLKEKLHGHRLVGLIVGIGGMLILLRPGSEVYSIAGGLALTGVFLISVTQVLMNILNRTERSIVMVFYMALISSITTAPFAIYMWKTPSAESMTWISMIAVMAIFNVYALVRALKNAQIGVLMPLDFTRLIVTAILAYEVFGEHLDYMTTLGAVIILAGAIYTVRKERHV